jgi:hypothetical protein
MEADTISTAPIKAGIAFEDWLIVLKTIGQFLAHEFSNLKNASNFR